MSFRDYIPSGRPDKTSCGSPPLTDSNENFLWINLTAKELIEFYDVTIDDFQCNYASFTRLSDSYIEVNETLNVLPFGQRMKIDTEYIQVLCKDSNDTQIYEDFHAFFPSLMEENEEDSSDKKYNVLIFGIDSVSKLNFHRMMSGSAKTLESLGALELHGYNKIDDNTYPNLIPFLTGLSAAELTDVCHSNTSSYYDHCRFIWDDFKRKGYSTLFSEDSATFGLFNYFKPGFDRQPTDFYFRTMLHKMEDDIAHTQVANYKLCLGNRLVFDVFNKGYLQKFIRSTANHSTFSFFWTSTMTHDYIDYPLLIDDDLSNLLLFMKNEKFLDNSIVFLLADHGLRWGEFREKTFQGMAEERLRKIS